MAVADAKASVAVMTAVRIRIGMRQTVQSITPLLWIEIMRINMGQTWAGMFEFLEAYSAPDIDIDCAAPSTAGLRLILLQLCQVQRRKYLQLWWLNGHGVVSRRTLQIWWALTSRLVHFTVFRLCLGITDAIFSSKYILVRHIGSWVPCYNFPLYTWVSSESLHILLL